MKKICYVFLDMDGVFNNTKYWKKQYKKFGLSASTYSMSEKNLKNIELFNKLLSKKYEIHYILSSTWRLSDLSYRVAESRLREHGIRLEGSTQKDWNCRGYQIRQYVNFKKFDLLIAIDDDDFDIKPYLSNNFKLLKTKISKGLTKWNIFDFFIKL